MADDAIDRPDETRHADSGEIPAAEAEPEPPAAEPAAETVYCPHCGAAMSSRDRFCGSCGWDERNPDAPLPASSPRELGPVSALNRLTVLLLCALAGPFGLHRFYVGKVGTGFLWLFTLGFLGIGVLYDLVLIATGEFRDSQGRRIVYWG